MKRVQAVSMYRYRATAEEKRRYGGSTVTDFYVGFVGETSRLIRGYGPTPGERKTDAIRRFLAEEQAKEQGSLFVKGGGHAT